MKFYRAFILGASVLAGCAGRGPASPSGAVDPIAERLGGLSAAAGNARSGLDSAIGELHRLSADTSARASSRAQPVRQRVMRLDSTYRAAIRDLLIAVNATTAGVVPRNARFPVAAPPVPLLHGFADGVNWMLRSPLVHEAGSKANAVIIVPRGFVSDLASIPEPLQILRGRVPNSRRYVNASLVHDYLYWRQDCTRSQADRIMLKAMEEAGVPVLERRLVFEGVRQFGQSAWDGNRRARQQGLIRTVAAPDDQVPPTATWAEYREWLRTIRAGEGTEYKVPEAVCRLGDAE